MKNQINELQNFIDKQKGSLKIKVRKQAISRAKSALILNGKRLRMYLMKTGSI